MNRKAFLSEELKGFVGMLNNHEGIKPGVSAKNVGWHLDHSSQVIIGVCKSLKKSDPGNFKWRFNHVRSLIFLINYIPRGKGRAPKSVLPTENIEVEALEKKLKLASTEIKEIAFLPANSNFQHPYFGQLDLRMTKKFLKLHTVHHLKICRDILK